MKNKKLLSFVNILYAFRGIFFLIRTERNSLIYLVMMAVVSVLGFRCHLNSKEWIVIIFVTCLVWMAEAFNTAIELLADEISEEQRERLGRAKDVAAGGGLFA